MLALALAAVIVVCLVQLTVRGSDQAVASDRTRTTTGDVAATPGATGSAAGSGTSRSLSANPAEQVAGLAQRPKKLRLPHGTAVPVLAVGTSGGQLQVSDDIRNAGWWKGAARIGDPYGAMLIAAHVDSATPGLGPYAQLLSTPEGAKVTVASGDLRQRFVISSREVITRDSLPEQRSIVSPSGEPRMVLVTCSGPYTKSKGGYQNLAVLTAEPAGAPTGLG